MSCVAFGPGTADPYSPKAVRASMGSVFAVPLAGAGPARPPGHEDRARPRRGRALLSVVWRSTPVYARSSAKEVALLVGSEREGLPDAVVGHADVVAHIPIQTDSLNAAMAVTIALYELTRSMAAK